MYGKNSPPFAILISIRLTLICVREEISWRTFINSQLFPEEPVSSEAEIR